MASDQDKPAEYIRPSDLYSTLDVSDESIRVLTLLPAASSSARLRCHLTTVSLQTKPPPIFEALSYVWGAPDFTEKIAINDRELQVTKSLDEALRRLRRRWHSRTVWVDQICINQDDLDERSSQVLLMGKIYTLAGRVVCWLGKPPSSEFEGMIDWCRHWLVGLYKKRSFVDLYATAPGAWSSPSAIINKATYFGMRSVPMDQARLGATAKEYHTLNQVKRILSGFDSIPYWSRMWILQEFVLAERSPLMLFGGLTLDEEFLVAAEWARGKDGLMKSIADILQRSYEEQNLSKHGGASDVLNAREEADMLGRLSHLGTEVGFIKHLRTRELRKDQDWKLSAFMKDTYTLQSGNPRDKMYALYSMVGSQYQLPKPEYADPVDKVLRDVMAEVISVEKSPKIYDWLAPSSGVAYPSWTPDFSDMENCTKHGMYNLERLGDYAADGARASGDELIRPSSVDEDHMVLTLHGWRLDVVKQVYELPEVHGIQQVIEMAWECAQAAKEITKSQLNTETEKGAVSKLASNSSKLAEFLGNLTGITNHLDPDRKRLFETLGGDVNTSNETTGQTPIITLLGAYTLSQGSDEELKRKADLVTSRASTLEDSVMFLTSQGFTGFIYKVQKLQEGDIISVISGCDFPYVLRPVEKGWVMVGSVFVAGIMGGEYVDLLRSQGRLVSTVEAFHIV